MTDGDHNLALVERLTLSFERIAAALEGLHDIQRKRFAKQYPQRGEVREAVVSRVPTEEDRIREAQGASPKSISEWLSELEPESVEEDLGVREREWLDRQKRDAGAPDDGQHQARR